MIRDLLVPLTGAPGDEKAVAAAMRMASTLDAHLTIVQTVNMPLPTVERWGVLPNVAEMYASLRDDAKAALERERAQRRAEHAEEQPA